ncbi:hypothetical protein LXL04_028078 [Taraxacum kok-saghyz]
MYALEDNKECLVRDRLPLDAEEWPRRHPIRDGRERTEEINLKNLIQHENLAVNTNDRWILLEALKGILTSAWIRGRLELSRSIGSICKNEWINWIPSKENIFLWRILNGRLAVRKTLVEIDIDIPSLNCEICGDQVENYRHLFFSCDLASCLWTRLGLWCKTSIPSLETVLDCFAWIDFSFKSPMKIKTIKTIVVALLKVVWMHRNDIIFNNKRVEKEVDERLYFASTNGCMSVLSLKAAPFSVLWVQDVGYLVLSPLTTLMETGPLLH